MTTPSERGDAIQFENLEYAYPPQPLRVSDTWVLRGVHFSIPVGDRAVVMGRTGVGKTTLLLSTVGIVPQRTGGTFRGRVLVEGQDTRYVPVPDLATRVGFLFQDPEVQIFQVRVDDEVAFALENLGLPEEEITRRVTWALETVGLADLRDRDPARLSGGQKQRLALATVLAMRPHIFVLDEPTANLDPVGRDELLPLLSRLAAEGHTLFLSTQEVDWAVEIAGSVHALEEGRLTLSGTPEEVFARAEDLRRAAVPLPQLVEIALALRQMGLDVPPFLHQSQAVAALSSLSIPAHLRPFPKEDALRPPWTPPPTAPPPIRFENVSFVYPNGVQALRDVSLNIRPGEFVALVGPNGAGKSTLARHMNGLLHPTRGSVWVGNEETRHRAVYDLARDVGYAFQNPDHQLFAASVREEIAFGPRNLGLDISEVEARVREMLDAFDLYAFEDVPPATLGFGLRRKVALAAVMASRPGVLILDEPTGGLDARSADHLMALVSAYHRAGHTIVLITHDMRTVAMWAPRSVVLLEGRVVFDGSTRDLFQQDDILAAAHLTPPPVTRLARALRPWGMPSDVLTVEEFVNAWVAVQRQRRDG